jgi:hypothetical protein
VTGPSYQERIGRRGSGSADLLHGLRTQDPSLWHMLDAITVRETLLQVDESYQAALWLFEVKNLSYRISRDRSWVRLYFSTNCLQRLI